MTAEEKAAILADFKLSPEYARLTFLWGLLTHILAVAAGAFLERLFWIAS